MLQKLQVITKDFFSSICKIYEYDIIEDPKGGGEETTQDHFPGVPSFSTFSYCRNPYGAPREKIWDPLRLSLARQLEGEAVLLEGW